MPKVDLSDFSQLKSNEFNSKPVEMDIIKPAEEQKQTIQKDCSDQQLFMEYLESDKSSNDLEEYIEEQTPVSNRENGNLAELLPPELTKKSKKTKKSDRSTIPKTEESTEPETDEEYFASKMSNKGFSFDEKTGILEF